MLFHQKDKTNAALLEVERQRYGSFINSEYSPFSEEHLEERLKTLVKQYENDPSVIGVVDVLTSYYIHLSPNAAETWTFRILSMIHVFNTHEKKTIREQLLF